MAAEQAPTLLSQVMSQPMGLGVGVVGGFVIAKALAWRKKRKNSIGGGF
jgi:hypothetical protein